MDVIDTPTRTDSCSAVWDERHEPVWGTAATASWWVGLEQPGPWGAKGASESRLGEHVGRALDAAVKAAGGRLVLLRHPTEHRDASSDRPRRLVLARSSPPAPTGDGHWHVGLCELWETQFPPHLSLLDVPWDQLASASPQDMPRLVPGFTRQPRAEVWVCAHAKRDVCCAVRGRALAAQLHEQFPGQVWESTHLVGHRFAPTCVLWPTAQALGRATSALVATALKQAEEGQLRIESLAPEVHRGNTLLPTTVQAAEAAVRHQHGITEVGCLTIKPGELTTAQSAEHRAALTPNHVVLTVGHRDGRTWTVLVSPQLGDAAPVSCGKTPVQSTWMPTILL